MAVLHDEAGNHFYPLRAGEVVIGRSRRCDFVIDEPAVSLRHAAVRRDGGRHVLSDLGSRNGTLHNGRRLTGDVPLRPGDRITLPGLTLVYDDLPAAEETADDLAVLSSLELTGAGPGVAAEAKLRAVLEISRNLSRTLDLNGVLPGILESLFAVFPRADRGFVVLRDPDSNQLAARAVRERRPGTGGPAEFSRTVAEHALSTRRAVLTADAGRDDRFGQSRSIRELHIRSVLCVPMFDQAGGELGVIQLDSLDKFGEFTQEDLDVLACAGLQAARALELTRLHDERRDLDAATRVQQSFLPAGRPAVPGLAFFDHYAAARRVSGDYFDYVPLPGGRLAVALGDVSGKGFPAALMMARLSAAARFALATEPTPAAALARLNAALTGPGDTGRFVTFAAAVIDLAAFTLTVVNAGHPPPLVCRPGRPPEEVGGGVVGIPLGVFEWEYRQETVALGPGETVVMYTDGVTEARGPDRQMYGVERLRAVLAGSPADPAGLGEALLADVRRFSDGRPPADDVTLVCFGRPGG